VLLRRDGHVLNRKRTQRLYREEGLSVRRRRSRKRAIGTRAPLVTEAMANARWSVVSGVLTPRGVSFCGTE
jgi:putative transposase